MNADTTILILVSPTNVHLSMTTPVDVSLYKYSFFHWMTNVVEENKSSVCVLTPSQTVCQSLRDLDSKLKALVYFFD